MSLLGCRINDRIEPHPINMYKRLIHHVLGSYTPRNQKKGYGRIENKIELLKSLCLKLVFYVCTIAQKLRLRNLYLLVILYVVTLLKLIVDLTYTTPIPTTVAQKALISKLFLESCWSRLHLQRRSLLDRKVLMCKT